VARRPALADERDHQRAPGGAAALATIIGLALAAALLLRAVPGRRVLIFGAVLPLLIPPQILALAAIQAGGPSSPLLLALDAAPPIGTPNPIYSPAGMILLLGIQGAPLVFLAIAGLVRRIPNEAMQAAMACGATPRTALRRIAWPVLLPAVAAGAGLAYVAALGNFGIAALIGIPARHTLLTVLLWQRLTWGGAQALEQVAALSLLLAALAAPGLLAQFWAARRVALPQGKPFVPLKLPAGGAASAAVGAYLLVVLGLPLLSLIAASIVPAMGMTPSAANATARHFWAALAPASHTAAAFGNSLALSAGAALILAAAAVPVALALAARPVRWASAIADLPYALPGACTGVAAILIVLALPGGVAIYGTVWLIGLAYLTRFQPLALRPVAAAAARLDPALDRAAASLGAGVARRLWRIHLPLLAPALAAGAILVMLLAVNEVTISSLLYGPGAQTLGVLVFSLQESGQSPLAAAVSCLALGLVAALMAAATLAARRLPAGTLPWRP
jgi:iron(III) transport system permease protein